MSTLTARQRPVAAVGETRLFSYDFTGALDEGELLIGTPAVVELDTEDLTITNKVVSSSELTIDHKSVASGMAVQFLVSGMVVSGEPYGIKITAGTDASQSITRFLEFRVRDEEA